jgi:methylglutaconyl-CoA hydratase
VISPYALAKIGRSAARELFLTGARFSAARAREIGLVHAVGDESELDRMVAKYVNDLLTSAPEAVAAAKSLIAAVSAAKDHGAATTLTIDAIAERRVSAEGQEGMRAFLDKRSPAWQSGGSS